MARRTVSKTKPEPGEKRSSDSVRSRMGEMLKEQLRAAIGDHPHYKGNLSEFLNECARAYVFQTRRGEHPVYPVEFVTGSK